MGIANDCGLEERERSAGWEVDALRSGFRRTVAGGFAGVGDGGGGGAVRISWVIEASGCCSMRSRKGAQKNRACRTELA